MLDRNVLRDLKEAFETGKIVTVQTFHGLYRGRITHVGIYSLVLAYDRSSGRINFQDIRNVWIREPLSVDQRRYEGELLPAFKRDMSRGETESFEPVKVLKCGKPLSFQDLKKRFCDHEDTATLTIPGNEDGFIVSETFCLVCRKTVEMEIKKALE